MGGDDALEGERLVSLGGILSNRAEERRVLLQGLDLLVKSRGADYYQVAYVHQLLGNAALDEHDVDEAVRQHTQSLELRTRLFGLDHASTISSTYNLAEDAIERKRPDEARAALAPLAPRAAVYTPATRAWYEIMLGNVARLERDQPGALAHHTAADALYQGALPDDPVRSYALIEIGRDLIALGRPREAIAPLESTIAFVAPRGEADTADARFELGRAYFEAGDRTRGVATVRRAVAVYTDHPDATDSAMLARAQAWLADHR